MTDDDDQTRRPRLGDREDLRIEILLAAVSTYRLSVGDGAMGQARRVLTDPEAREELEDILLQSYVTYSSGDTMRVRARVRRLEVDCESELIRVTPDHVRCIFARSRRLDTRTSKAGSGRGEGTYRVRGEDGARIGRLRVTERGIVEWRPMAESSGAAAEPWGRLPPDLMDRAGERFRPAIREWLKRHGVER